MSGSEFHIVLHEPVIPQNTGSIARLCACTDATLHLIHPLGFQIDEAAVKRAGLDYWPHVKVKEHENWASFLATEKPEHLYLFSKFAKHSYLDVEYKTPSYLVLGSETKGLPGGLRADYAENCFRIPIRTDIVRSLNLAQAAAIALFEAMRHTGILPEAR